MIIKARFTNIADAIAHYKPYGFTPSDVREMVRNGEIIFVSAGAVK